MKTNSDKEKRLLARDMKNFVARDLEIKDLKDKVKHVECVNMYLVFNMKNKLENLLGSWAVAQYQELFVHKGRVVFGFLGKNGESLAVFVDDLIRECPQTLEDAMKMAGVK